MIWRCGQSGPIGKVKHGHTYRHLPSRSTPTYRSWKSMHMRCEGKYAVLGITVCERWSQFEQFLADMGERPPGTTLDRWPNNQGDYEPGNCRWATPIEQSRNRKSSRLNVELATIIAVRALRGERQKDIARDYGVSSGMVHQIVAGKSWRDALAAAKEVVENDQN